MMLITNFLVFLPCFHSVYTVCLAYLILSDLRMSTTLERVNVKNLPLM